MSSFLIVDREGEFRQQLTRLYNQNEHEFTLVHEYKAAEDLLQKSVFNIALFDTSIKDGRASSFVKLVKQFNNDTIVFIITNDESSEEARHAIENGAFDLIQKPFRLTELEAKINRALSTWRMEQGTDNLIDEQNIIYKAEHFIGESPEIRQIFEIVLKIAKSNSTVLLNGETGTGKELIAGAIHYNSNRAEKPFVKVNCAVMSEQQLESELFGQDHMGTVEEDKRKIGSLELADGGSIFLDEVGDLSLSTQQKVLRVVQHGEFKTAGGRGTHEVDVRIITATNKNLLKEIEESNFRADLFYRLNTVTMHVPPLRERKGDIILLAYSFLKRYCRELKKSLKEIHPRAIKLLTDYHWPGNMRELQNAIERAVLTSEGNLIRPEDFGLPVKMERMKTEEQLIKIPSGGISLEEVEKQLVLQALRMSDWVQKDAADLLGISSRVLNYKIKRFQITHSKWKRNK
jgi:two-component system response regulator HydG